MADVPAPVRYAATPAWAPDVAPPHAARIITATAECATPPPQPHRPETDRAAPPLPPPTPDCGGPRPRDVPRVPLAPLAGEGRHGLQLPPTALGIAPHPRLTSAPPGAACAPGAGYGLLLPPSASAHDPPPCVAPNARRVPPVPPRQAETEVFFGDCYAPNDPRPGAPPTLWAHARGGGHDAGDQWARHAADLESMASASEA